MSEIYSIGQASNLKMGGLSSKSHASLESVQKSEVAEIQTSGMKEIQEFKDEMTKMNQAFALVSEIRLKLEKAYSELSPPE